MSHELPSREVKNLRRHRHVVVCTNVEQVEIEPAAARAVTTLHWPSDLWPDLFPRGAGGHAGLPVDRRQRRPKVYRPRDHLELPPSDRTRELDIVVRLGLRLASRYAAMSGRIGGCSTTTTR